MHKDIIYKINVYITQYIQKNKVLRWMFEGLNVNILLHNRERDIYIDRE